MTRERPPPPFGPAEAAALAGLAALAVLVIGWRWVGFQGSDDHSYAVAAQAWVDHFPALGDDHWALRYPIVLPIAAVFALFGTSVGGLAAVCATFYIGVLVVNYLGVRSWFGWKAAALTTVIGLLLPVMPVQGTYVNTDMPEMFFVLSAFWLFLHARRHPDRTAPLILAGVCAGLGFLTRETTLAFVVTLGLLFLAAPGMARRRYLAMALGFAVVVGAEMAYFTVMTGNPLYRQAISAHHDHVDRDKEVAVAKSGGRLVDGEGVLSVNKFLDPVLVLAVSQKFGLLFYLAIPATLVLMGASWLTSGQRRVIRITGLLALVWFLFIAINGEILYLVPRYFMVSAALASIPVAVAGARLLERGPRLAGGVVAAGFALSCLLLLYLENTRPLLPEEMLVDYLKSVDETIYTDPLTLHRTEFMLKTQGLADRLATGVPPNRALVVINPASLDQCRFGKSCGAIQDVMAVYEARADWIALDHREAPTRWISGALRAVRLDRVIPPDILRKIERPNPGIEIYRAG